MKDLEGICFKVVHNGNMGGNEIHVPCNPPSEQCSHIIEIDKTGTIKIGDHIKVIIDETGKYLKVFVNGIEP